MHKLYATLGSGNCYKPFLAFSQLGVAFRTIAVDVLSGQTRGPDFLAVNPAGAVPYLVTAEGEGLGESNAMLWYIADGTPLMPATPAERARALQWMFFEQSKLEPFISPARFLGFIAPERGRGREAEIAAWQEKARAGLRVLDAHLAGSPFIAGDRYGIGDIGVYGYVHVGAEAGLAMDAFPHVMAWIARVAATPGYRPLGELCREAEPFAARRAP